MEQNTEKNLTKYDRKLQAKEEAAKREKKKQILTIVSSAAIVLAIVLLLVLVPYFKGREGLKEYFKVGKTSVSQLEFNYYKTNITNTYSQFISLYGVDTSVPFELQMYDQECGMTWADFFDQEAAVSVQTTKVLVADAKEKGLKFDVSKEYNELVDALKSSAKTAGEKLNDYLYSLYGPSATLKYLEPIIKDELTAAAYNKHLNTEMTPTDAEAQAKYEENKADYDSVDYHVLDFPATVAEGATEEEIKAAMDEVLKNAQEMLDKVNAGEDFETLCETYASEDSRDDFADPETERSLYTGVTKAMSPSSYGSWLFEERTEGETTLYTDEANYVHHVIKFEKRYMEEGVLDTIKSTMATEAVSDYTTKLAENYKFDDPEGYLTFLQIEHNHE